MKRKLTTGTGPNPSPNHHHRRTHTKSRRGCQTCKARKVKCSEDRPICVACQQRSTPCIYPDDPSIKAPASATAASGAGSRIRAAASSVRILPLPARTDDAPSDLHLADLRLLHHFLTTCYPHLPAGNEAIWTSAVPVLAASRPYLMHALLGLAATHLGLLRVYNPREADCEVVDLAGSSPEKENEKAMTHRAHALEGLHLALAAAEGWSRDEVDSMLAAAYALTFQATFMADGLVDFVTMVRGCALITRQIGAMGRGSRFGLEPMAHVDVLEDTLRDARMVEAWWVDEGLRALAKIRARMESETREKIEVRGDVEWLFLSAVETAMRACCCSVREAYVEYCRVYGVWYETDTSAFERLVDPKNEACRLVMAFFLGLELLMAPVFGGRYESEKRRRDVIGLRVVCVGGWLRSIEQGLSAEWKMEVRWPMEVSRAVDRGARAWIEGGSENTFGRGPPWADSTVQAGHDNVVRSEVDSVGNLPGAVDGSMYPTPEEERR